MRGVTLQDNGGATGAATVSVAEANGGAPPTFAVYVETVYWPAVSPDFADTWRPYARYLLARVVAVFGPQPLDAITVPDVLAWWGAMLERYGVRRGNHVVPRRTALMTFDRLKAVFSFAVRNGHVATNPARVIRKHKPELKARRPLSPDERARLVAVANPQLAPYVLLALHTLGRAGSLRALRERDVDLDAGELRFVGTKNGDDVTCPMTPDVRAVLTPLLTGVPERRVLYPYHPSSLKCAFRRLCRRVGIIGVTFHGLRHDGARALIEAGVDPLTVKAMLGHRTLLMTDHYTKMASRRQQKLSAVAALAALGGGAA